MGLLKYGISASNEAELDHGGSWRIMDIFRFEST
jgi:hypothetical protein